MAIWTDEEARQLDPEYYHRETDEEARAYDDALERAVNDRIAELELDLHFYRREPNGTKGYIYDTEIDMTDRDLMFTTRNILLNDPEVREAIEKIILSEDGTLDKYLRGEL